MNRRLESERGAALILAFMAMTVLMALGTALVLMTSTDTVIAANFRGSREAFYAAEAVAELAVAELRTSVNWTPFVEGVERSRFVDGAPGGPRSLPGDAPVNLSAIANLANCAAPAPCGGVPRWQLFAYGPLRDVLASLDSPFYVVALITGGQTAAGEPLVTVRAEAFGPKGAHQAIEVTLGRSASGDAVVLRTVFA